MKVGIVAEDRNIPSYATNGSAGVDLKGIKLLKLYSGQKEVDLSVLKTLKNGKFHMRGFERALLGTGIYVAVPEGYELQIRSRSGQTLRRGLIVANAPGTIDSDYRGEIGIILCNLNPYPVEIVLGEYMAQAVLAKHETIEWEKWKDLSELGETGRGAGGFGHTDKK